MATRILFDRSIFHGNKFDQLRTSSLVERTRTGDFEVFLTPMFFEETLMCGLHDKSTFISHWKYISAIHNQQWFKLASQIIEIELGNKLVDLQYYLQFDRLIQNIRTGVERFIAGDLPEDGLQRVLEQIDENRNTRQQNRQKRLAVRLKTPPGQYRFEEFFEGNVEWFIEKGLMDYHSDSERFLDTWRKQRVECPFSEYFIRAWLSTIFLPAVNHQLKVGENDRADAEQLAFLQWADIMVSDDTRFMKAAFDLLYSGTGKCLMTLHQFLCHLGDREVGLNS
jgi:hypothetical protein